MKDTAVLSPKHTRLTLFKTQRRMNDYGAEDMRHGDYTESMLRELGIRLNRLLPYIDLVTGISRKSSGHYMGKPGARKLSPGESARELFSKFREMAWLAAWGPHSGIIQEQINHMQHNTGLPFRDRMLDNAYRLQILGDKSESGSLNIIKELLPRAIDWKKGDCPQSNVYLFEEGLQRSVLPKFMRRLDWVNGLGLSVHDVHATHITLVSLAVQGDRYQAKVHFHGQDHFGLDRNDILDPLFRQVPLFPIWFVLQHWKGFGFRPFLTNMEATIDITGQREE